ncbi:MAG: ABC transporter ATP-binding protein [Chloroflexi bacterium]|nr:MAG: ABC transporter ATP-binding protein [Chloroflexota bacterium]
MVTKKVVMDKTHFLIVRDVDYAFSDGKQILSHVTFSLPQGAFVALVGQSGVGKSTLLRIVSGLLRPFRGEVLLNGRSPHEADPSIGLVFQHDNLLPWRTAYGNVRLPLELRGENGLQAHERVQAMLKLVGLEGYADSYPAQLSGGMAQRVALARALVHQPSLLLLDEPFGALDALTRERMGRELLRIWQAHPVTVLMVTHSITEAVLLADEVLVMNGRPATITHRIPVPLTRPREENVEQTAVFQECVTAVRSAIQIS